MTVAEAIIAVPLWAAAGAFVAVVIVKLIRDLARPSDPNNPYDI